jgi:hypothetical protein
VRRASGVWPDEDPLLSLEAVGHMGVFARRMEELASEGGNQRTIMIDATYLTVHRTASSLRAKKGGPTTSEGV